MRMIQILSNGRGIAAIISLSGEHVHTLRVQRDDLE
jgi:hypothetical protein